MLRTTPRLVILDEATANIDSATDRVLQELVREAFAQATVLIVAHRLQTVSDCDRLLVMGGGRLLASGSPSELMQRDEDGEFIIKQLDEVDVSGMDKATNSI